MQLEKFALPTEGEKITIDNGVLKSLTTRSFLLSKATARAATSGKLPNAFLDAAVEKAYNGEKKIAWYEVFAGEKAFDAYGEWLPADTLTAIREIYRRDQRTFDDADRRRYPFLERCASPRA